MPYMTLSSQEQPLFQKRISFMTPFFTLFVLSRASDYTTSQNIGGTDAWAVPHLTFLGGLSPPRSPPLITSQLYLEIDAKQMISLCQSIISMYCLNLGAFSGWL